MNFLFNFVEFIKRPSHKVVWETGVDILSTELGIILIKKYVLSYSNYSILG